MDVTNDVFTDNNLADAEKSPILGPHYFSARDFMERTMAGFEAEHFAPMIEKFRDEFYRKVQDSLEASLFNDAECNVQGEIWRTVDRIVQGILSGERWVVERYALGSKFECDKIRESIARHIPKELQDARVDDLMAENAKLRKSLELARR